MSAQKVRKIALAYSGGLDTSIIIPWLKENYDNPYIIAVAGNVGQQDELEGLEEKAYKTGADKFYAVDLCDELVNEIIIPSVQAGAKYEDYLLGTAFARPVIAKKLVEIAIAEGADAVAHGCTGKGNDQVRFEARHQALRPHDEDNRSVGEWSIPSSRDEETITPSPQCPAQDQQETKLFKDKNLWHLSHEGRILKIRGTSRSMTARVFLKCPYLRKTRRTSRLTSRSISYRESPSRSTDAK